MATSAFVVRVPEAEPAVGELRLRYDESARLGVPAHVTILFPFMEPDRISEAVLARAAAAVRSVPSFDFQLFEVCRFPLVAYLAPALAGPFIELTEALTASFPEFPPYEGRHTGIVPHLTVANGTEEGADHAARSLAMWLVKNGPIQSHCAGRVAGKFEREMAGNALPSPRRALRADRAVALRQRAATCRISSDGCGPWRNVSEYISLGQAETSQ